MEKRLALCKITAVVGYEVHQQSRRTVQCMIEWGFATKDKLVACSYHVTIRITLAVLRSDNQLTICAIFYVT